MKENAAIASEKVQSNDIAFPQKMFVSTGSICCDWKLVIYINILKSVSELLAIWDTSNFWIVSNQEKREICQVRKLSCVYGKVFIERKRRQKISKKA